MAHSRPSPAASALEAPRGGPLAAERLVEAVGALEDRPRAREAGLREVRGHDARVGGPARVEALGPGAVGQVLDDPARLAAAEPERRGELGRAEAEDPPDGRRRAERAAERGRVEAAPVERPRAGPPDRGHHLDAGDERRQHLAARGVTRLARGERGRRAAGARVDDRLLQRVVVVEPVGQGPVGEDGGGRAHLLSPAPEARLGRPAEPAGDRVDAGREVLRHRGQRHAGRVQQEVRGLPGHAGRQRGGETVPRRRSPASRQRFPWAVGGRRARCVQARIMARAGPSRTARPDRAGRVPGPGAAAHPHEEERSGDGPRAARHVGRRGDVHPAVDPAVPAGSDPGQGSASSCSRPPCGRRTAATARSAGSWS